MAEFMFTACNKKTNKSFEWFVSYEDGLDTFVIELLKCLDVELKLETNPTYLTKRVMPTNWDNVLNWIESIIEDFFENNRVFRNSKGPTIYLEYRKDEGYINVSTDMPKDQLLCTIDWKVL